jgi:hypothetical protein
MNPCSFFAVVEIITYYALAVAVCVEIYCSSRDYADEVGAQTFEESSPALHFGDLKEDLAGFADVE